MRHVLGVAGVTAAGVLLIVSAAMNWRFGYTLGKSGFESQLYGAASAAADCFKALLPFFIFAALRNRSYSQALGGALLFAVCFSYSLTSSLGFAALNRADTTGSRILKAETHQDLRAELEHTREALKALPAHRPTGTVNGEIEAFKQNGRWFASGECSNATSIKSMSYCEGFFKLQAERAVAEQADKYEAKIAQLRAKLGEIEPEALAKATDPQSQVLAGLTGRSTEEIQTSLTVLIALLVELGASLGFYTAFSYWRIFDVRGLPAPAAANGSAAAPSFAPALPRLAAVSSRPDRELQPAEPKTDVEMYYEERVGKENGSSVTALALYDDYCQWCEAKGKQPLGLPIFTRRFSDLGVQKAKVAGRIRYLDVRLLFGAGDDGLRELSAVS
ncbi:MAG TPA: hypothetical protein VE986_08110 [Hyphomicrobiales bacterium]|nr:hypothetical protein [Hyphomicrobiales bacterium]